MDDSGWQEAFRESSSSSRRRRRDDRRRGVLLGARLRLEESAGGISVSLGLAAEAAAFRHLSRRCCEPDMTPWRPSSPAREADAASACLPCVPGQEQACQGRMTMTSVSLACIGYFEALQRELESLGFNVRRLVESQ